MKKSMIEVAYGVLKENGGPMPFIEIYKKVSQEMGFTDAQFEDKISQFYSDLSIDGRFFSMPKNNWDLRSKHTFSESVTDTDSLSVEDEDEESEENQENEENSSEDEE